MQSDFSICDEIVQLANEIVVLNRAAGRDRMGKTPLQTKYLAQDSRAGIRSATPWLSFLIKKDGAQ